MTRCWGLTSGQSGMIAQVQALAGVLGEKPDMKTVSLRRELAWLPNPVLAPLRSFLYPCGFDPRREALAPPWPDLVISAGRRAALVALGLRQAAPTARYIHIQDPQVNPRHFDLVVAMQHDRVAGPNVISTPYALHNITPSLLREAAERFAPLFATYARPYVAVLLGGSTNKYRLTRQAMASLLASLHRVLLQTQGSLLITPSRRTGADHIAWLREKTATHPPIYLYDGAGENPYLGLLALADFILVTNDSVNMMSEARATGKPLYILPLPGHRNTKPARFAEGLVAEGSARYLADRCETWHYPVDEMMEALARQVQARVG